ncbi:hypothetical protein V8E36_002488 [Tilletia maclaganii]
MGTSLTHFSRRYRSLLDAPGMHNPSHCIHCGRPRPPAFFQRDEECTLARSRSVTLSACQALIPALTLAFLTSILLAPWPRMPARCSSHSATAAMSRGEACVLHWIERREHWKLQRHRGRSIPLSLRGDEHWEFAYLPLVSPGRHPRGPRKLGGHHRPMVEVEALCANVDEDPLARPAGASTSSPPGGGGGARKARCWIGKRAFLAGGARGKAGQILAVGRGRGPNRRPRCATKRGEEADWK